MTPVFSIDAAKLSNELTRECRPTRAAERFVECLFRGRVAISAAISTICVRDRGRQLLSHLGSKAYLAHDVLSCVS